MSKFIPKIILILALLICPILNGSAEIIKDIKVTGNQRISSQSIILFSKAKINNDVKEQDLNFYLKNLYDTDFFKNISIKLENNILSIKVIEEPIIQSVIFKGIKAQKILEPIKKITKLKDRSSYKENIFLDDKKNIQNQLRILGYYFADITGSIEDLGDNKINLIYEIDVGEKARISKITFSGNKIYKDKKLRNLIISEEYKFWKFISGKKFLNEEIIKLDKNLLKNFYLNNGYYDIKINTSFAKLISKNSFELIFNIDANKKYFFNNIDLKISKDYSKDNFEKIYSLFDKLKGEPYSINSIDNIMELIDEVVISEQFESINATVSEQIDNNKINMVFEVTELEKYLVERINIFGNNVTDEKVIRNQLLIDEGDPYNEILKTKSINRIKSLNFFRNVESEVLSNDDTNKIINIKVEEKPTGEITAGAGVGTDGSTIMFGVNENNFLGKGISVNSNLKLSEEDIKGNFTISNPNFNNSEKSLFFNVQTLETDRMSTSGYKTNKSGFRVGTDFEYYDDLYFGVGTSNYYEKISTDSTASARQQKQKGHYWDSFLNLNFTQDKRNQKFQTSKGHLSRYDVDIPLISDTNSFINRFSYKYFSELYNENVSSVGLTLSSAFSLDDSDVKLSERLFIPSNRLRGFEGGKVGPKDGNDFVGGNYLATLNLTSSLPQIMPNSQETDFSVFLDVANIWGVDYDSSINDSGKVRSSIGIGLDWFTVIGPISFSYAHPLSKDTNDVTQEFSFNLGTTF
tara:strand:- start:613 stop:2856 length:2244 start_codon:yes stop_codon:yes gene_type:complete